MGANCLAALLVSVLCVWGCGRAARDRSPAKASDPLPSQGVRQDGGVFELSQCRGSRTPLPVAALTVAWQEEDRPSSVVLRPNGNVQRGSRTVARVVGTCVVDSGGRLLVLVDDRGEVRDTSRHMGRFQRATALPSELESLPTSAGGEVLVLDDGSVNAVTDDGGVFYARSGEQAISMPARVEGAVPEARRTALLLLTIRTELGQP